MPQKTIYPQNAGDLLLYIRRLSANQNEARRKLDDILIVLKQWAPKGVAAASKDLEFVQSLNLLHLMADRWALSKEAENAVKFAAEYISKKDFFSPLLSLYSMTEPVPGMFDRSFSLASDMNGKIFSLLCNLIKDDPGLRERAKSSNDPKFLELYAITLDKPARTKLSQYVFWHYDSRQYSIAASAEKFNSYPFGASNNLSLKQNFSALFGKVASEPRWVYTALAADCFSRIDGSFYAGALKTMIDAYEKDDFMSISKLSAMMLESGFEPQGDWKDMISGIPKAVVLVFNSNARLFSRLVVAMSDADKNAGFEKVMNIIIDESDERMWKLGMAILSQCIRYEESHYGGGAQLISSKAFKGVAGRAKAKLKKKGKLEWVKTLLEKGKNDLQFGPGAAVMLDALSR